MRCPCVRQPRIAIQLARAVACGGLRSAGAHGRLHVPQAGSLESNFTGELPCELLLGLMGAMWNTCPQQLHVTLLTPPKTASYSEAGFRLQV